MYGLYNFQTALTNDLSLNLGGGMGWLSQYKMEEVFYFDVSQNNFQLIGKAGLSYQLSEQMSFFLNGTIFRGLHNFSIQEVKGGYSPLSYGMEMRVGYKI